MGASWLGEVEGKGLPDERHCVGAARHGEGPAGGDEGRGRPGVEPPEGEDFPLNDLVGRELELRIDHESYLGSKRARVRGYRSLS